MNRTRAKSSCPDCNEVPKANASGSLTCACKNKQWQRIQGTRGTEEEEKLLTRMGFEVTQDCQGDVYYIGPDGQIIWLYSDSEWICHEAPADCGSLEKYFDWLPGKIRAAV